MPSDADLEERAIWKLGEAGYDVRSQEPAYRVIDRQTQLELGVADLGALKALADVLYGPVWTGRTPVITPSA